MRGRRAIIFLAAAVAMLALAPAARAAVEVTIDPVFTVDPVTVGTSGHPGSMIIINTSTAPDQNRTAEFSGNDLRLTPSCVDVSSPPCPRPDPGVLTVGPTATGVAGTACAGRTFTVTVLDNATGEVAFTPNAPVTLAASTSGSSAQCRINFTYAANRLPAADGQPGEPGLNTNQNAFITLQFSGFLDTHQFLGAGWTAVEPAPAPPPPPPPLLTPIVQTLVVAPPGPTGQQAAAVKRCKKKFRKGTKARKKCLRRARLLPV